MIRPGAGSEVIVNSSVEDLYLIYIFRMLLFLILELMTSIGMLRD
jgi:hypothetical protein